MTGSYTSHLSRSTRPGVKGTYMVRAPDSEVLPANLSKADADMIVSALNGNGDLNVLDVWASTKDWMLKNRLEEHIGRARAALASA